MLKRLLAIIRKEFIQMRRDRLTLAMMLLLPLIQLAVFGFAINTDVKHVPMAVLDRSNSAESRRLTQGFTNSDYFDLKYHPANVAEMTLLIDGGYAKVGLVIDADFALDIKRGRPARAQVLVDASDPIIAASALSNTQGIAYAQSLPILYGRLRPGSSYEPSTLPVDLQVRGWYNPDLVTSFYIVPGLIGVLLTMTMMMITSMAIVKERERGTLEQLLTTPIQPMELMIGKMVPYAAVGFMQVTIALVVGIVIFKIPIRGSLLALYGMSFFFIVCYLSLGLLISTLTRTQQQAMQLSFFVFLPTILLSGFMFPRAGMPLPAQILGLVMPLTYFMEVLRGILLKGVSITLLWRWIIPMIGLMFLFMTLSVIRFRKQTD
jgi:ABC-2 type transport system permease protein